jgi:hypothetical protein
MSVIKVGALQDLSGNTDFDLTNNVINGAIVNASTRVATASLTDTSGNALINTASRSLSFSTLNLGTAQNSTSGTSIDFTGIPSWVKRVTVVLYAVSTNGSSPILVQIGSGSILTSGYSSQCSAVDGTAPGSANSGAGFLLDPGGSASFVRFGSVRIETIGSNTWSYSGVLGVSGSSAARTHFFGGASATLSGALDRVRITTVNGTDLFDAGSINIMWE